MNNGNFGPPGPESGNYTCERSGQARTGYDHSYKMNEGSDSNGSSQTVRNQMTGPGYGTSAATSFSRSQYQDPDFGLISGVNSSEDGTRPSSNVTGVEYVSNPLQYHHGPGHQFSQLSRSFYQTSASSKSLPSNASQSTITNSVGPVSDVSHMQSNNFPQQRMHSGSGPSFAGQQSGTTPTLNHLLQSSNTSSTQGKSPSSAGSSANVRDETGGYQVQGELSPAHLSYPGQQQQGWGMNSRTGPHHFAYQHQAPGSSLYRSQSGGNDMSQGRRPAMGAMGGSYPQQGGQYMGQQMAPMGPGPGPQRFMMGGQMPSQMYPSQAQMYIPPSSQQPPGPPVSPAARPLTPQLQQMQNMVSNSPKQPSPALSISSDHGSTHSMNRQGEDGPPEVKMEVNSIEEPSGDNSRGSSSGPRPVTSPVGSTSSRSNTPASIPGAQAGSPMPVRPPTGQLDGPNRMTQSPMATQGYNQQMMPPPNSMGFMPSSGKMTGGGQMPGPYPQYNSQYPQGNYGRHQPGMGGMAGPGGPMSGPMQNYPGSQHNIYPNGPSQMPGAPMYGNMPSMNRSMAQSGYGPGSYSQCPSPSMGGMINNQYPGYNSHMGPMPVQHGMPQQQQQQQQQPQPPVPGPPGSTPPNMAQPGGMMPQQHGVVPQNKAVQAAQAAMMAAASSVGPRMSLSHSRGSMSPSRGMFGQAGGGGGPLAQMNNMTNSPNLGSPSLNSMSNAVEQLGRGGMPPSSMGGTGVPSSTPSPVPKSSLSPAAMPNNSNMSSSIAHSGGGDHCHNSPLSNTDTQESSRPNSAVHPPDLTHTNDTTGSDSSGGVPSDSTSVDSGFHSSDQGDKISDSMSTPTLSGPSPPLVGCQPNGEASLRTIENVSPPGPNPSHHMPPHMNHHHMGVDSKMPYCNDGGVPLPPSSMSSSTVSIIPSPSSSVVTTVVTGPMASTSVTHSIASPVTSSSVPVPIHHQHPHPHPLSQHMGPHGVPHPMMGHGMVPGHHGMMQNGMPPSSMMNAGPNQMPPNMPPNMMHPNMGGPNMNMNQNGPLMGPNGPMMGHNGPMMSGPPTMNNSGNNSMPPIGQMQSHHPQQQQQQQQQSQSQMNCMPMGNNNSNSNNNSTATEEQQPEKKKKVKELEGVPRASLAGAHYSEEPNSPGALKSSSDLSKLFELGLEPDRRPFLERVLAFLEETGQPVTSLPVISKTPLDLFKLYFSVREKGGFEEVTRSKKWREICTVVNIGTSASAAFTLKKNYIRYLFNYECKFDRGGINPAPILAQMEAQLAHKREQKNKRAPSPGSNSNDAFRPPSTPSNQMDSSFPPGMPPPYMQNPDGNMPNAHMSGGNMMMPPNNMMGGPGHHGGIGSMMGGPPGMMGGPASNMMPGQQGMMPNSSSGGNMMGGPQMMPGGPPGYGGPMSQQPGGPVPGPQPPTSNTAGSMPHPPQSGVMAGPVTSDSISVQDPFSDEPNSYLQQRGGPHQSTPPAPSLPSSSTTMSSTHPGMQQSSMGSGTMMSSSGRATTSSSSVYGAGDGAMMAGFPNSTSRPSDMTSGGQFAFGQQFERPDRFDQSSPNMAMRPPGPTPGMAPSQQPPQQPGENGGPMYPGTRFPGPPAPMMRAPQPGDGSSQYSPGPYPGQGGYPGTPGPQYPSYPQTTSGPFPSPRPPSGGMYGTPNKRFPDVGDHGPALNQYSDWSSSGMGGHMVYPTAPPPERQAPSPDEHISGQWSPLQRSRMPQGTPGYMPPAPPSTPPMGPYGRQMVGHRSSPQNRDRFPGPHKVPKPCYGGLVAPTLTKKELVFPSDSVEGVHISTPKHKKLTHKDLAPFEAWRLMLALKSGMLAESTWALDTMNVLLYDDTTFGYFNLGSLPGLLEVLTEHFRQCLIQMFEEFRDLEQGQSRRLRPSSNKSRMKPLASGAPKSITEAVEGEKEKAEAMIDISDIEDKVFQISGPNFTKVSRKGLPVKIDNVPSDSTVLETKDWDIYTHFDTKPDHWLSGCGDITDHIFTHFESSETHSFLSNRFRRKRARETVDTDNLEISERKLYKTDSLLVDGVVTESACGESSGADGGSGCNGNSVSMEESKSLILPVKVEGEKDINATLEDANQAGIYSNSDKDHSKMCNGSEHIVSQDTQLVESEVRVKLEPVDDYFTEDGQKSDMVEKSKSECDESLQKDNDVKQIKEEPVEEVADMQEKDVSCVTVEEKAGNKHSVDKNSVNVKSSVSKPVENGDIEEPKLSPMVNHKDEHISSDPDEQKDLSNTDKTDRGEADNESSDCSPPVLKAECMDGEEDMAVEGATEPMNSTMNQSSNGVNMEADTSAVMDTTSETQELMQEPSAEDREADTQTLVNTDSVSKEVLSAPEEVNKTADQEETAVVCETYASEELSASIVAEWLKEDEHVEDEAYQRDDPPLCVTLESHDELGRRCVSISNIIRSLSCVPGNEAKISRHPGIMRVLGRLLLLHHCHPERPHQGQLPSGDEDDDEREQPPRVYDDEHWWWDYLDQLRENTLVILANICGHLRLDNFSEEVCFPLLEGLLHWVICPASVAKDPLPTLGPGSILSPQRLVLEALCKLCISESNVDLLLATPPVKRLLELYNVLVHLLADRNHQITREFSIVLLSFLVPGDSSAARAVALQHPCVSLLVDFLETAEQNALAIANQQGLEVLQSNPEVMGTSLDMLRRSACILLHMARVPDNRKMFVQQQSRLLNLVMSQILDQSVSNTLSEVLFECSQFS